MRIPQMEPGQDFWPDLVAIDPVTGPDPLVELCETIKQILDSEHVSK